LGREDCDRISKEKNWSMSVRVRFAPSPTGDPHIGNIRTVVFNWLFARKMGGKFILRIEDTDRTRYKPGTIVTIMEGLRWLGLEWDEGPSAEDLRQVAVDDAERLGVGGPFGPYIQTLRAKHYRDAAEELVRRGWAYRCNCTRERLREVREMQRARKQPPMYDRCCRNRLPGEVSRDEPHVIRLKVPLRGKTVVRDLIKGDVVFDNASLDDQVLLKSDGLPTYHLAVVVDDHLMQITHVIRGDDWIPSAPKRVLLYEAFGWELPVFCHVPLVTMPGGRKLAKREGATSISQFQDQGYLPEALLNYLAFLGWAPGEGEEREIFSCEELINQFDLGRISKSPAAFSYDKLDWINGVYIRALSTDDLLDKMISNWQRAGLLPVPCPAEEKERLGPVVPLVQERLKRLEDVVDLTAFIFRDFPTVPADVLTGKKMTAVESLHALRMTRALLETVEPFASENIEAEMRALAERLGLKAGQLFGIVRWSVTGQKVAPPLFGSTAVLGRETALSRLSLAVETLTRATEEQPAQA
jgi:glutamyl-tRNA synthetase